MSDYPWPTHKFVQIWQQWSVKWRVGGWQILNLWDLVVQSEQSRQNQVYFHANCCANSFLSSSLSDACGDPRSTLYSRTKILLWQQIALRKVARKFELDIVDLFIIFSVAPGTRHSKDYNRIRWPSLIDGSTMTQTPFWYINNNHSGFENASVILGSGLIKDCFVLFAEQQPVKVDAERSCVETDSIETGLRKTGSPLRGSPSRSSGDRTPRANSIVREGSNVSRASNSSRGNVEVLSSPEGSPLKRAGATRSSVRKVPANSTCGVNRTTSVKNASNSNTWNGRQTKQRTSIKNDTFSTPSTSFSRKNSARMSLPRYSTGPQYDRNGRRIRPATSSLQSSPTKTANPLLEQIMNKVGHLQDDKEIVQKLQDLLKDYKGKDSEEDSTMEFTRAWIDGNGTVALPSETQVVASPRKDPKPDPKSGFSRIPAPVYKRSMSIASNKVWLRGE